MMGFRESKQQGFTLLEIMVALAVLALSGIALLSNVSQASRQLASLDEKVVALSVAEYAVNQVLLTEPFPETGSNEEIITLADREWRIELTVSETPNEDVRRIDALVSPYVLDPKQASVSTSGTTVLLSAFQTRFE
jgi:general secretion pathway protein I